MLEEIFRANAQPLDEQKVIELIKKHSINNVITLEIKRDNKPVAQIKGAHCQFERVLKRVASRLNVYLMGPAGSGKTTIAEQCAQALGLPFYFTGAIFQKYELLGFVDAMGNYQSTEFRQAYENGGVFLFDEMDASDAGALVAFNAAIANGICSFPDKQIKKHADFYCIGAANTNGNGSTQQYSGRTQLDGATMDRYVSMVIHYDEMLERRMVESICAHSSLQIQDKCIEALNAILAMRKRASARNLPCIISPRASVQAATLITECDSSVEVALVESVYNKMDGTTLTQMGGNNAI
jgi:MoxR-like ATPase